MDPPTESLLPDNSISGQVPSDNSSSIIAESDATEKPAVEEVTLPSKVVAGVEENILNAVSKLSFKVGTLPGSPHMVIYFADGTTKKQVEVEYADHISLWFDVNHYIVFSHNGNALTDASERRVLFSALVTSLDISHRDVPVFLSSEPIGYIRHSKEVLGYQILVPRLNEHEAGLSYMGHPAVGHFESSVLTPVTRKNSLYYLDGLSRLFGAKLWRFSSGVVKVSEEVVSMSSWETYNYQPHYLDNRKGSSNGWASPAPSKDSFVRKAGMVHEELSVTPGGFAIKLPPALQSTLEDLRACFPEADDPLALSSTDIPLWKLSVQLHFAGMKQSAVVDNDYYTTLIPSKLPPPAFSASAEFSSAHKAPATPTAHELMSEPSIAPIYSSSLRRLLAMYVCGKSCKPGHTFRSLSGKDGPVSVLNTDKAINISSILSTDSRRAVVAMCAAVGGGSEMQAANDPASLPQDLLMRVFSRSLWVDDAEDPADVLFEDHFGVDGVQHLAERDGADDDDDESEFYDCMQSPNMSRITSRIPSPRERTSGDPRRTSMDSVSSRFRDGSTHILPWRWLGGSNIVASPVGSWLSLVSVYVSSLRDIRSMTSFWVECVEEVRVHWENRVPIPRLFPPVPIAVSASASTSKLGRAMDANDKDSLLYSLQCSGQWMDPLWTDVIDRKRGTSTPFMLPEISQCLPFQKLQMINMCIICSEESTIIESDKVQSVAEGHRTMAARRLRDDGMVDDMLGSPLPSFRQEMSGDSSSAELEDGPAGRNLLGDLVSEQDALLPVKVDLDRDISHLKHPSLQRRLPVMTDTWAQHKRLTQKIHNGESRTINDNPMLRWQISVPALLSDVRSFKACNPDATVDDFLTWYGGVDQRIDLRSMEEIWRHSPSMAAEEQKPMFKAEQEAEKALGYLEGLSLAQLAAVLLTSAMTSFHMMMSCDIKIRCSRDRASAAPRGLDEDFDLEEELQQDLDALERLIKEAAELIEKDTSMFGTTNHAESSVSQQTLLVIDQVCNRMFELEILQLKMKACEETLDRHHRIIAALSRNGSATAQSSAEAKHLLALAKSASFGGDSHSWHSYDGRELGPPSRKVFDLRCRAECKLLIAPTLPHDNKRPLEHIMRAVLENDELRIAFKLFESDGAM